MMKPIIGVMPLYDDEKESLWMLPGYMEGIMEAGGIPVMLPLTGDEKILRQSAGICDGFLLTGGHDVSPELYREKPVGDCVVCCPQRDRMDRQILELANGQDKPVLGICRGIQLINAAMGGTLYQDLPSQYASETDHHQSPPYDIPAHHVRVLENTPLRELLGKSSLEVNSYHHQAVREIAGELQPMAVSEDGLIEALYHPGHRFLWALQWHPEFSFRSDENSRQIFRKFVEVCAEK